MLDGTGGNVAATVTDDTSGPVSASLSAAANVSSVGNKGVSLTGSDNAGNSTTESCSYRVKYSFLGFLSPIPQSSFKASSTIPVKFMLANAAGTKISDAAALGAGGSVDCVGATVADPLAVPLVRVNRILAVSFPWHL